MTTRIPAQVKQFAAGNLDLYKAFVDYWNHHSVERFGKENLSFSSERSLDEKESLMNAGLRKEIFRKAGIQNVNDFPLETWAGHPTLRWASFAVVSALIDMILPQTIIDSIGAYTDVSVIGFGDSASFDIEPRDLFIVSKAGRAMKQAELRKQYKGQVNIIPENREISVSVSLYKVLSGAESLADFVAKAVRSLETQVTYDVYSAFATAMDAIDSTASTGLLVAGYSQTEFVRLSQTVAAWNQGARPLAIGTQAALSNILPADANYRYDLDSEYVKMGYMRNFQQTDVLMLPQVANFRTPFGLKLADDRVWIVSPSVNKLVKLVLEGSTLAYSDSAYQNADLSQNATLQKSYGAAVATNAVGATIQL